MKPLVIFLNGTSSAGKTSISKALQSLYPSFLLHTGIDTLYDMIPKRSLAEDETAKDGYYYVMKDGVLDHIEIGPSAQKLINCTIPLTDVLIKHTNNLVIDEILFKGEGRGFLHEYAEIFSQATAYFVKVACDLKILEQREEERGNRHRGLARMQYNHVHEHQYAYDISVDSGKNDAFVCANQILEYIKMIPDPQGFAAVRAGKKRSV